ncbi:MAG: hydroxymethylbilane synthase [Actinomycetota bacterium]|nr:hydroxymethylbilane synthase [Actinomycetota bacterium]
MKPLRIGTRRSSLALAQVEEVRRLLAPRGVEIDVVPMSTSGDEGVAAAGSPQGLKGLWIDTILDALENGEIDLAVHSAKDLPAAEDDDFVIAAVPERADPFDVLVTREATLPAGARIGTSSIRRRAQLLASDPTLTIVELRGNVDTRMRKLAEGEVDAAVLAAAGLARLGIEADHRRVLGLEEMVPAPGQGCLALQTRSDDEATIAALVPLDHRASHVALDAERSVAWRLGGGCDLPLGVFATIEADGRVAMIAIVASPDGARVVRVAVDGEDAEATASRAAKELIADGAQEILAELEDA